MVPSCVVCLYILPCATIVTTNYYICSEGPVLVIFFRSIGSMIIFNSATESNLNRKIINLNLYCNSTRQCDFLMYCGRQQYKSGTSVLFEASFWVSIQFFVLYFCSFLSTVSYSFLVARGPLESKSEPYRIHDSHEFFSHAFLGGLF